MTTILTAVQIPNGTKYQLDIGDPFEYLEAKYPDGGAGLHNSIFRGKNLGSAPTTEQYNNIKNGTFKGIWLGDYYHAADGRNYRYGCLNWGSHIGDNVDQGNNALIIPDTCVLDADGNTTKYMQDNDRVPSNGYLGTKMWTDTLPNKALPILQKVFGSHIISHREILCSATSNGIGTGWAYVDVTINIPNQIMVYGNQAWMQKQYGDGYQQGTRHHILPLFLARPDLVNIRQNYWLSDFTSSANFAYVTSNGCASSNYASHPGYGVRPYVIID